MVSQIDKRKHKAVLSLGGNIGNVQATFNEAKSLLKTRLGNIVLTSSLYKTKAWGVVDQPDFLNQVVVIETVLLPTEVLNHCLAIEAELGRVRKEKWHERLIDIDVLFYDAAIIHTQELVVPRSIPMTFDMMMYSSFLWQAGMALLANDFTHWLSSTRRDNSFPRLIRLPEVYATMCSLCI